MNNNYLRKLIEIILLCVSVGLGRIGAQELKGLSEPIGIPISDRDSQFENLAKQFELGVLPSRQDITGWHSGRMFGAARPNQPAATLLVGATRSGSPQDPFFRLFPFLAINQSPDYYEHITEQIKREVSSSLAAGWERWTEPKPEGRSLIFSSAAGHRFEERRFEGRIIEKWINPSGNVVAYSYYSKDVTPDPLP